MTRRTRLHAEALDNRCLPSFSPAASYAVGPNPQAVATADFNHDGRLDLVTSNPADNTISVLLGDGQGGFGLAGNFDADGNNGADRASLAVADVNGDGHLDVATVQFYFDTGVQSVTSFLLGNGDGTFQTPIYLMGGVLAAAAGDLNADGNSDLVLSVEAFDSGGGYLDVYLSDGTFSSFWMINPASALTLGDVNGDGKLDVVALGGHSWSVLGNGDGTFVEPDPWNEYEFFTTPGARQVALGDYTGDGKLDVVFAGDTIAVHRGHGDGHFDGPINYSANGNVHSNVATGDVNGDGKLDAVTADADVGTVTTMLGNGDGTLSYVGAFATGSAPSAVVVGDFNGDGRPDVAAANAGSGTVSVLLNDGDWDRLPPPPPPPPPPSMSIGNATVTEGNSGTVSATFTVSLSAAIDLPVTVSYSTYDSSASAGSDYRAASGTLTFAPGETTKTITVLVNGDRLAESSETFLVRLADATNATIAQSHGVGTIVEDEPRVSISDVTKAEGKKGKTTLFTFTVTLSAAYDQPVTVSYRTANGTATTGDSDYVGRTGTLTFAPGETTKMITIEVKGDSKREADEYFYLDLFGNSDNSLFSKNLGIGTILNDD